MAKILQIDSRDNVMVALQDLHHGDIVTVSGEEVCLVTDVPCKHKFMTEDRAIGEPVIMYGVLVGRAREPIPRGAVITARNLAHDSQSYSATRHTHPWTAPAIDKWSRRTFSGFHRADGQVGTRNYWLVIPLVFCENRNVLSLQEAFEEELGYSTRQQYRSQVAQLANLYRSAHTTPSRATVQQLAQAESVPKPLFQNIDGVRFLTHQGGCGGTREDSDNLCALIAGYLHHPNVAGATVLSLGCQHAQVALLLKELRKRDPHFSKPLIVLDQQAIGTESELMDRAIRETFQALIEADKCTRAPAPLSQLTVGLKCGGSDGFSGISANPAIGQLSDLLAALGGKSLLSEFPELCGVEQSLIDRCATQNAADKFVSLMHDYATRAKAVRSGFEMNPSPGNIQDGLITDAIKSAGAARKSGTSPVNDVLDYPEYAVSSGLNLLCTPGNDVECVTAQVAAGANLVLFTTGLGTPTGNPVAPVVKISTSSALAERMPDIIDIDTGSIITGQSTIEQMADNILEQIIEIVSGKVKTKAELLGQNDFIPWKRGVSL